MPSYCFEVALQITSAFQPSTSVSTPSPWVEVASTSKVLAPSLDHNIAHMMVEFDDLKLHLVNAKPHKAPQIEDKPRIKVMSHAMNVKKRDTIILNVQN